MGTPTNTYTVTVSDAHSHTLTWSVPASSSPDAIRSVFSRDLTPDTTNAAFVMTDTMTVTAVIA